MTRKTYSKEMGFQNYVALLLLIVATFIVASCDRSSIASTDEQPKTPRVKSPEHSGKIECLDPVFDFGTVDNIGHIKHTYILHNAGTKPLRIFQVQTSCGCTAADLPEDSRVLQPDSEAPVKVSFDLQGRTGQQHKEIRVHSSDAATPILTLELKGTLEEPIEVRPVSANFGVIKDDNNHTVEVTLTAMRDDAHFDIEEIKNPLDGFTVNVTPTEPGKKYVLAIGNQHPLPPGNYRDDLVVVTNNERFKELRIRVSARVYGDIVVSPSVLPYREGKNPTSRRLRVLPGRDTPFEVTEVIPPFKGMKVGIENQGSGRYIISLDNFPENADLANKEVIIRTTHPKEPEIHVPFQPMAALKARATHAKAEAE